MLIVAFFVLVAANAFFVASEFGLVAADRPKIDQLAADGDRQAKIGQGLLKELSRHLSGAQLGITVTSLLLGFVAEPAVGPLLEPVLPGEGGRIVVAIALATIFQMVVGELLPKSVAISNPVATTRRLARPTALFGAVAKPLVWFLNGCANAIVRRFGVEPKDELHGSHDLGELEFMIKSSGTEGTLDPEDVDLLTRSIRFSEKDAADALVPRVEVRALRSEQSVADLVEASVETGFSRFPVYVDDLDDVIGVVHVKSVYSLPFEQRSITAVTALMSDVLAVPEARELEHLFADLRNDRDHIAIVVDEHGGTAGIITLEDLLEEIVGEIDDEYDEVAPVGVTRVESAGSSVISASLHPDEVEAATGFVMPEGDYETLAGFILAELGYIPSPGEIIPHDGWRIEVVAMDRHRIVTARVVAP